MIKRNQTKAERARAGQQNDSKRWRTYALMFIGVLVLASGFFFAGRQHFSSMDYGMKNSRLRRQVDELVAEKRRLMLAREVSLSPAEIKKAVKKAGMMEPQALESEVGQVAAVTKEKAVPVSGSPARSMVIKTVAVTPVPPMVAVSYKRPEKAAKEVRKAITAE